MFFFLLTISLNLHPTVLVIGSAPKKFRRKKERVRGAARLNGVLDMKMRLAGFHFFEMHIFGLYPFKAPFQKNQFVKWLSGSVIDRSASSRGLALMQAAASRCWMLDMRNGYGVLVLPNGSGCFSDRLSFSLSIFFFLFFFF